MNVSKLALAASGCLMGACGQDLPDPDAAVYLGDVGRTHYSELVQIDKDNVGSLQVAWVYDTNEFAPGVSTMLTSPLVVDGVLYGLSPTLNAFALNAATGEALWRSTLGETSASQRGLMWSHAATAEDTPRLFYTSGPYLVALDPRTGRGIEGFGESGKLDLRVYFAGKEVHAPSPGIVFEDLIVLGIDGSTTADGSVLALSVGTGEIVWQLVTGVESLSGAGVATAPALDAERGLVFVATGPPRPEFYGGERYGDNLYANTLLALDARSGALRWHHQVTRHDLWARELASPPTLVQVERSGQVTDAVALATRSGHLYLFDRVTGAALYQTKEIAAVPSAVAGEQVAPQQTVSTVAFTRGAFEITDRDDAAAAAVATLVQDLDRRAFAPPSLDGVVLFPGVDGGAGWGGTAYDPARRKLIVNTQETATILRLIEVPAGFSDRDQFLENCARCHGADRNGLFPDRQDRYGAGGPSLADIGMRMSENELDQTIRNGRGSMPPFSHLGELQRRAIIRHLLSGPTNFAEDIRTTQTTYMAADPTTIRDTEQLPGSKPPWGSLVAVDLDSGAIDWQAPFGNYPSHPQLGLGAENAGGPLLTASGLLFIAATPDMKISAYDASEGALLWQADLDAAGYSTPVTYRVDGRQYVVIAAGGGLLGPPSGSTYMAFGLPD